MTTPKTPLGEHLAAVVRKRLGSLRENADSVLSTDSVDAVHDVRVASRRLRAFLDVFRPAMDPSVHTAAKKALRKLSRAMGPLRDADVLALAVAEHGARAGSDLDKASVDLIRVHLHGLREEARESGRKKLRKIDLRDVEDAIRAALDSALSHLPEDPLGTSLFALSLLSPFVVKMQDAAEHAASERAEDLHELRIRAKRVRYAVELLQPCLGEAYRALHEQIQAVQETLG
ncbi:MAG TPA: CHAD domain-containing protein, partial [Polyangiaceae bacterium]|nr:CHAD domain-containing protein [Polyangiaceae bacterium]